MKTKIELSVRFSDCDPMGHTNNAVYFSYMEQTRVALFKELFGVKKSEPLKTDNFPFILAEISCRFLKPTYADQWLEVEASVTEVGNSSFIINYSVHDKETGQEVATGRSAQVWYDYKNKKSIPIPAAIKEKFSSSPFALLQEIRDIRQEIGAFSSKNRKSKKTTQDYLDELRNSRT